MDHHIGGLQCAQRLDRQKIGVAGPGADKDDVPAGVCVF